MRTEPNWVEPDDIAEIVEGAVDASEEPYLLLNEEALDGAVMRPRQLWHYDGVDDLAVLAVRLCIGIAKAHAFLQGNKRGGFIGSIQFLASNGQLLDIPDVDEVALLIKGVIENERDEGELVEVYRDGLIPTL